MKTLFESILDTKVETGTQDALIKDLYNVTTVELMQDEFYDANLAMGFDIDAMKKFCKKQHYKMRSVPSKMEGSDELATMVENMPVLDFMNNIPALLSEFLIKGAKIINSKYYKVSTTYGYLRILISPSHPMNPNIDLVIYVKKK